MAFEDFFRPWKVKSSDGSPSCTTGCRPAIGGSPADVTVSCNHGHVYENGRYEGPPQEKIWSETYTLRLRPKPAGPHNFLDCSYASDDSGATGSWTADDTGTEGDDE